MEEEQVEQRTEEMFMVPCHNCGIEHAHVLCHHRDPMVALAHAWTSTL